MMNDKPTLSSPRRLNASGSQSQWDSIDVLDKGSSGFNNRRPGGGVPNRLDTYKRATRELDIALASADRVHHDDDDMSVDTPSVATAVTANVSQVTPDDSHPVEESRGRRSRSNSSGRARQRRYRRKAATRQPSPDTRRLAMCGYAGMNDEIRASMRDVADSVRQILSTVRRFGPDERDAVRATLCSVNDKVRATLSSSCGRADVTGSFDVSDRRRSSVRDSKINDHTRMRRDRAKNPTSRRRSPVRDSEMNGYARIRRDRADSHTSQRGRESSSRDDKWRASRDVRCRKNEKAEECSDMVVDGCEEVVHNLPVVDSFDREQMFIYMQGEL